MKIIKNELKVGDKVIFNKEGIKMFYYNFHVKPLFKEIFRVTRIIWKAHTNLEFIQKIETNNDGLNQYILYNSYFKKVITITI